MNLPASVKPGNVLVLEVRESDWELTQLTPTEEISNETNGASRCDG